MIPRFVRPEMTQIGLIEFTNSNLKRRQKKERSLSSLLVDEVKLKNTLATN